MTAGQHRIWVEDKEDTQRLHFQQLHENTQMPKRILCANDSMLMQ